MTSYYRHRRSRQPAARQRRPVRHPQGKTAISVFVAFAVVLTVGLLYVGQVNGAATSGIEMQQIERQISQLKQATQDLELQAAQLRSLSTIERVTDDLRLVERPSVEYLPTLTDVVARGE